MSYLTISAAFNAENGPDKEAARGVILADAANKERRLQFSYDELRSDVEALAASIKSWPQLFSKAQSEDGDAVVVDRYLPIREAFSLTLRRSGNKALVSLTDNEAAPGLRETVTVVVSEQQLADFANQVGALVSQETYSVTLSNAHSPAASHEYPVSKGTEPQAVLVFQADGIRRASDDRKLVGSELSAQTLAALSEFIAESANEQADLWSNTKFYQIGELKVHVLTDAQDSDQVGLFSVVDEYGAPLFQTMIDPQTQAWSKDNSSAERVVIATRI